MIIGAVRFTTHRGRFPSTRAVFADARLLLLLLLPHAAADTVVSLLLLRFRLSCLRQRKHLSIVSQYTRKALHYNCCACHPTPNTLGLSLQKTTKKQEIYSLTPFYVYFRLELHHFHLLSLLLPSRYVLFYCLV